MSIRRPISDTVCDFQKNEIGHFCLYRLYKLGFSIKYRIPGYIYWALYTLFTDSIALFIALARDSWTSQSSFCGLYIELLLLLASWRLSRSQSSMLIGSERMPWVALYKQQFDWLTHAMNTLFHLQCLN